MAPDKEPTPVVADPEAAPPRTGRPSKKPLKVKVDLQKHVKEFDKKRRPYWCGTVLDSPVKNLVFGGIDFGCFEGYVSFDIDNYPTEEFPTLGDVIREIMETGKIGNTTIKFGLVKYLTEEQVKRIQDEVAKTVIRVYPDHAKPWRFSQKNYEPSASDVPAAKFVWMIPGEVHNFQRTPSPEERMLQE